MRNSAALKHSCSERPLSRPDLIETLRALHNRSAAMSEAEVRDLLSALALCRDQLTAFERFEAASYCRNRIFSNQFVDLLLLCWRPGQRTPIHDHANSTCGVYVMRGEAIEIGFKPSAMGPLVPCGSETLGTGDVTVSSSDDIHLVANYSASGEDLVTLHCYSPPLRSMRVYSEHETFFADYSAVTERAASSGCYHVDL